MSDQAGRAGDYGYPGLPRYITALEDWVHPEIRRAFDNAVLPDGRRRLCLGVIVYGAYVDRFLELCVPSLLAPGNIESLLDPLIIIHTDAASIPKLAAGLGRLLKFADIRIDTIPAPILEMVSENPANKYWLLGAAHNLHMQQAKYSGRGYHMLMPDHVYGIGYFENLARLAHEGKKAIVQGALSATLEEIGPAIEASRGAVEPDQLTALALDHLHAQVDPFLMNGRSLDEYPMSLLLVMVGQSATHLISPHMSIIYLSHDVLMRAPMRMPSTIDGQLPFFIPEDVEAYAPSPDDGMVYVEVSDRDKAGHWTGSATLDEFCARFWVMSYCCRGFERFFGLTTLLRHPQGYRPPLNPLSDDRIAAIKTRVREAVAVSYAPIYAALPERHRVDPLQWSMRQDARKP